MVPTIIISPLSYCNSLLTGLSFSILSPFSLHMEASIKTHVRSWHFSAQNHLSSPPFTGSTFLLCIHLHYSLLYSIPAALASMMFLEYTRHTPATGPLHVLLLRALSPLLTLSFEICIQIPPTQITLSKIQISSKYYIPPFLALFSTLHLLLTYYIFFTFFSCLLCISTTRIKAF